MSSERYKLIQGDCLSVLPTLADASVHCCVTSPPYFNLRDYGTPGQLGLESLHDCAGWATGEKCGECFICRMTAVFSEVRRVLRDDGTCWVNIGDSFSANRTYQVPDGKHKDVGNSRGSKAPEGIPPKNLLLIPQRLALSLQADGWYVRCDIVWNKPNPMPESVTDRPTKAHEYVWLLSKSEKYFYDAEAIKEHRTSDNNTCGRNSRADVDRVPRPNLKQDAIGKGTYTGFNDRWKGNETKTRNARSVWTIATQPYPEAHFATFPEELVEPCILAGCPDRACPSCGAPWIRVTEKTRTFESSSGKSGNMPVRKNGAELQGGGETKDIRRGPCVTSETVGWKPTCECGVDFCVPGVALDPFAGSGTVGAVALRLDRRFLGIELNQGYVTLAHKRINAVACQEKLPLFGGDP